MLGDAMWGDMGVDGCERGCVVCGVWVMVGGRHDRVSE
jgi:hypothetical protein